jgi:hypothetical protein
MGTKGNGIDPNHYCQAYDGEKPPKLLQGEEPLNKRPVKVDVLETGEFLRDASRINLLREYRIEHNTFVRLFGKISDEDLPMLHRNYVQTQKFPSTKWARISGLLYVSARSNMYLNVG